MTHVDKCPVCNSVIDYQTYDLTRPSGFECTACSSVLRRKKPYFLPHIISLFLLLLSGNEIANDEWDIFTVKGFFYLIVFVVSCGILLKIKNKSGFNILWKSRK